MATHIEGRVSAHRIAGLDEKTAVERTLEELGQPAQVSTGMMSLHSLPSLVGLGALIALICALTITLVSSSLAQSLNVTQQFPSRVCFGTVEDTGGESIGELCKVYEGSLWTSVEALKEVLEPQGVKVASSVNTLKLTLPGETRPIFIPETYDFGYPLNTEYSDAFHVLPGHLLVWDVLDHIAASRDAPLEFGGWDNPKVHLGDITFQLGTPDEVVKGNTFYIPYLVKVAEELFPPSVSSGSLIPSSIHPSGTNLRAQKFQLNGKPGDIYGVITVTDPYLGMWAKFPLEQRQPSDTSLAIDVAPATQDGSVTFQLPDAHTIPKYVTRFSNQPRAGETIVVRLTGKADRYGYGYEVVSPDQIKLE